MFDEKCYELAKNFLSNEAAFDTPENHMALAEHIQMAIEDWIEVEKITTPMRDK